MTGARAWWLAAVAAIVLTGAAFAIAASQRQGNDVPKLGEARQMLVPAADARRAMDVGDDTPSRGFRTVVFFLPNGKYPAFVASLRDWGPLADSRADYPADIVAVFRHEPKGPSVTTPVGGDPFGDIARAYGITPPRDGGPPVGYAIVDSQLRVRFAANDSDALDHLNQIAAILEAVP